MDSGSIFRRSSLERVQSPEQLNEAAKSIGTCYYAFMTALLILLVCSIIWSMTGTIIKNNPDGTKTEIRPYELIWYEHT